MVSKGIFLLLILLLLTGFTGVNELLAASYTPASPTSLSSTGVTVNSASLSWSHTGDNVTGFNIYRNGSKIDTIEGSSSRSYTNSGLAANTTYSYYVTAINEVYTSTVYPAVSGSTTYSATSTSSASVNYSTLYINANTGDALSFSACSSGTGDTYFRLYYQGSQVSSNDDSCGYLSAINYTATGDGTYELHMGCYNATSCSATVNYSMTKSSSLANKNLYSKTLTYLSNLFKNLIPSQKFASAAVTTYESSPSSTISVTTSASDTVAPVASLSNSVTGGTISSGQTVYANEFKPTVTVTDNVGVTSMTYCKSFGNTCTPNQTNYPPSTPIIYDIGYLTLGTSSPHVYICYYAQDAAGNRLPSSGSSCPDFYRGIAAPTGLSASASGSSVTLSWSDNSIEEYSYEIYSSFNGGAYNFSASRVGSLAERSGMGTLSYTISNLADGTYSFKVYAALGDQSPWSNISNTVTVSSTVAAPTNFVKTGDALTSISFSWTDVATDETSYILYNDTEHTSKTMAANTTSTTYTGLNCGQSYSFILKALKNTVLSSAVNLTASTRSCDVTPPTCSLSPAAGTNYSASSYTVSVSCSDSSGVANIYTCTDNNTDCSTDSGSSTNPQTVTITYPITHLCYSATDTIGNITGPTCATYYLRPTQPNSLDLTCSINGPVTVSWWDTSALESSFTITRTGPQGATFSAPAKSVTGFTSYIDSSCPTAGDYTYAVAATNAAGSSNTTSASCYKYTCDTTAPTGSVTFGVSYTNSSTITANVSCSDSGSGCKSWALYDSSSCSGTIVASGTGTSGSGTVNLVNGVNVKAALLTDNVNLTTCVTGQVTKDVTPPSGGVSINSGAASTTSSAVSLTLTCSDNSDAGDAILYNDSNKAPSFLTKIFAWLGLDRSAKAATDPGADGTAGCRRYDVYTTNNCTGTSQSHGSSPTAGATSTTSATLETGVGTKYISVKYMDGSGNTSCTSDSINVVDNVAPSIPQSLDCRVDPILSYTGSGSVSTTNYKGNATCTWSASTDSTSGVCSYIINDSVSGAYAVATNTKTFSGLSTGNHIFKVLAVDCSGNSSSYSDSSLPVSLINDTVAPVITSIIIPLDQNTYSDGTNTWVKTTDLTGFTKTISISASDSGGSGLDTMRVYNRSGCTVPSGWTAPVFIAYSSSTSFMFDSSAAVPSVRVYDKAGNSTCLSGSTPKADGDGPTISGTSTNDSQGRSATTNQNVPVFTVTVGDALSGLNITASSSCSVVIPKLGLTPFVGKFNSSGVCTISSISNPLNNGVRKEINGTYTVSISNVTDNVGNSVSVSSKDFIINNGSPTVVKN